MNFTRLIILDSNFQFNEAKLAIQEIHLSNIGVSFAQTVVCNLLC